MVLLNAKVFLQLKTKSNSSVNLKHI